MWSGRGFIWLLFFSSDLLSAGQNQPTRIPKVLYSCDTAGVMGCFPLVRNGDRSYALGNLSKTGFGGEATVLVEQFATGSIVLSYKDDADKTATFTGKLQDSRIQGAVASTIMAGGKPVKLDGKWIALAVMDAPDFSQISSHMPAMMNVCQTNDDDRNSPKESCFNWSWDPKNPVFAGNLVTVESISSRGTYPSSVSLVLLRSAPEPSS